jgi:8-oxo-dGTP diphosphatase
MSGGHSKIPYKVAVLVYVFNDAGEMLLLHRGRAPNLGMYSPIGGKLEQDEGESPFACAIREAREEIGVELAMDEIRMVGIVSERAFPGHAASGAGSPAHWLMFCFESLKTFNFPALEIDEGRLEWVNPADVTAGKIAIPQTDRQVIWPLVLEHSAMLKGKNGADIFSVHIDCTNEKEFAVIREHPRS